jgi:N-acylglucosamine 2-epimerase
MSVDFATHLTEVVLPWWERNGIDDAPGVRTCFDNRGRFESADRLTWSQGRWAWLSSELALDAEAGRLDLAAGAVQTWAERSRGTARFLARAAVLPDGRTRFRLDDAGRPPAGLSADESASSVFADLFAALGIAGALRAPGSGETEGDETEEGGAEGAELREVAARILRSARSRMATGTARTEPYPVHQGFVDLASPMTRLHAASEASRAGVPGAREISREAWDELVGPDGLLEPGHWWEFRPGIPSDDDTLLARHITPGHLLELLWMLVHAADQDDALSLPTWLPDLASIAIERGWDEEQGGIFRYTDRSGGTPRGRRFGGDRYEELVLATADTKLWWVQVEALYTARLLGERFGRADLLSWADRIADYTFSTFPDPDGAEWIQIRARDGSPLDAVVALPVKDPFHIIRSLILLNRLDSPA